MSAGPAGDAAPAGPGPGDAALRRATGRTWDAWLAYLDGIGAAAMGHAAIAQALQRDAGVAPWWSQTVATGYERARGRRRLHQKADGFQISASKTLAVEPDALYAAWADATARARWLPAPGALPGAPANPLAGGGDGAAAGAVTAPAEPFVVRKATPARSLRLTWTAADAVAGTAGSRVDVTFYPRGGGAPRWRSSTAG